MSKRILFLIVLLLIQPWLFPQSALAVSSCKDIKINWDPKIFSAGEIQYVMNVNIQDANTLSTLKDKYVRLFADAWPVVGRGGSPSPSVKVKDSSFSFVLTGDLAQSKSHSGVLQWSSAEEGDYQDFCSDINYQIGSVGACTIVKQSIPEKIRPNTELRIQFVGKTDTDYDLRIINPTLYDSFKLAYRTDDIGLKLAVFRSATQLTTTKTSSAGQAIFPPVAIPGKNGDTNRLVILSSAVDTGPCFQDTTINPTAPDVPAPLIGPPLPVLPAPAVPAVRGCPKPGEAFNPQIHLDPGQCSTGGGKQVEGCNIPDPNNKGLFDPKHPGIPTAIGCIHTNPAEFVKDLMKFIIGIGGGLAFLMMLLGAFQMLTSQGNPETLNAGRERLTSAVIGLLFVIFAVLFLQIIGVGILAIPGFE